MPGDSENNSTSRFKATVCGTSFEQGGSQGAESLVIEDHVDMIGIAQLTMNVGGASWKSITIGGDFEAEVGGSTRKLFKGYVTEIRYAFSKGQRKLTIVAMDPLVKLNASRVTKVYEKQKDSDIASSVISAGGCSAGTVDATSAKHDYVLQRNESNLNFLRRLPVATDIC